MATIKHNGNIKHPDKGKAGKDRESREDPLVTRLRAKGLLANRDRAVRGLVRADLPKDNTKQGKQYFKGLTQAAGRVFQASGKTSSQEVIESRGKA